MVTPGRKHLLSDGRILMLVAAGSQYFIINLILYNVNQIKEIRERVTNTIGTVG